MSSRLLSDGEKALLLALHRWNIVGLPVIIDSKERGRRPLERVPDYLLRAELRDIDDDLRLLRLRGFVRRCRKVIQWGRWRLSDGRTLACGPLKGDLLTYYVTLNGEPVCWGDRTDAYALTRRGIEVAERFARASKPKRRPRRRRANALTDKQEMVLRLSNAGFAPAEIARQLGVTRQAVAALLARARAASGEPGRSVRARRSLPTNGSI